MNIHLTLEQRVRNVIKPPENTPEPVVMINVLNEITWYKTAFARQPLMLREDFYNKAVMIIADYMTRKYNYERQ